MQLPVAAHWLVARIRMHGVFALGIVTSDRRIRAGEAVGAVSLRNPLIPQRSCEPVVPGTPDRARVWVLAFRHGGFSLPAGFENQTAREPRAIAPAPSCCASPARMKTSAAMSGSKATWDMNWMTLRPVISSTALENAAFMAIWKT
jgi:hypothetical protein